MLEVLEHSDRSLAECGFSPPAPKPQPRPLKPIALIRTLKRNPLECWAAQHFEQPIVAGGLPVGHVLLVHEPTAIRRVLLDNAANYRKDRLQRRVLSAGLNEGLLSAEGEQWRLQRRVIAPIFARKTVMDFTPAMMGAADVPGRPARVPGGKSYSQTNSESRICTDVAGVINLPFDKASLARRASAPGYLRG